MAVDFGAVRHLEDIQIREKETWLYAADFNVGYSREGETYLIKNPARIDAEIEDILQISESGGVVVILAHQGRYGSAGELDFVVPYLSEKLGMEVKYFGNFFTDDGLVNSQEALDFVASLGPGNVAILDNTRKHPGEEKSDPVLAKQFSELGQYVAVGGWGKAHRKNSSNIGILEYLSGYVTRSQLEEMRLLAPWAGRDEETLSVAVLGGIKKEKITTGLVGFVDTYDAAIPGGITLNTIYAVMGYDIGDSIVEDSGKTFVDVVEELLDGPNASKILVPDRVVVAKRTPEGCEDAEEIKISEGVPKGYGIVDSFLPGSALEVLDRLSSGGGRLVLAGPPGVYAHGFREATRPVLECVSNERVRAIALGGDTVADIGAEFNGITSTGGGSSLHFIVHGTTPVFEALKANKEKFPESCELVKK